MSEKVFKIVFDELFKLIEENGYLPWEKPWKMGNYEEQDSFGFAPVNFVTGKTYSGFNTMWLCMICNVARYERNEWAGYKQYSGEGIFVRKGQKATKILAPIMRKIEQKDNITGEIEEKLICVGFRYVNVWNIHQTTHKIEEAEAEEVLEEAEEDLIGINDEAEKIIAEYETIPPVSFGGNRAYYYPAGDNIRLPKKEQFKSQGEYYNTYFHEMIHSTGHSERLNRFDENKVEFASRGEDYSFEELVAELGACYLSSEAEILDFGTKKNSAAYLQNWLKQLKSNPKWLVEASVKAEKACRYILNW